MKISTALQSLVPGAQFAIENNDYNKIQWFDSRPMPSKKEVDAEVERLETEWVRTEYQRNRRPEYPSLEELADALYWNNKGDQSKLEAYYAKVEEVKNKYPKE